MTRRDPEPRGLVRWALTSPAVALVAGLVILNYVPMSGWKALHGQLVDFGQVLGDIGDTLVHAVFDIEEEPAP